MNPAQRAVLRRTQIVLLVLVVCLGLNGRREHYWPIVTWPVYGTIRPAFPPETKTQLQVRVVGASGVRHALLEGDLVERSRDEIAGDVIEGAARALASRARAADRAHLVRLVALVLGDDAFESIEIWQLEWQVDPFARPSLILGRPDAPWFAANPDLGWPLQLGVLVFEASFFAALFGRRLRNLYLNAGLIFHSLNALFMLVTFTPVLIVYAMFFDWEALRQRLAAAVPPKRTPSSNTWIAVALVSALALAATWHVGARNIVNAGGLIDWQTPWFFILPVCSMMLVAQLAGGLLGSARRPE